MGSVGKGNGEFKFIGLILSYAKTFTISSNLTFTGSLMNFNSFAFASKAWNGQQVSQKEPKNKSQITLNPKRIMIPNENWKLTKILFFICFFSKQACSMNLVDWSSPFTLLLRENPCKLMLVSPVIEDGHCHSLVSSCQVSPWNYPHSYLFPGGTTHPETTSLCPFTYFSIIHWVVGSHRRLRTEL